MMQKESQRQFLKELFLTNLWLIVYLNALISISCIFKCYSRRLVDILDEK